MKTTNIELISYCKKVTFHPYRTKVLKNTFLTIDRDSAEGKELEEKLAKMANVDPDNHVVYTIEKKDGSELHFWVSDFEIRIGVEIIDSHY